MNEKNTQEKAITLIALIITIIVLLILAGISMATLTGENGFLTKSLFAKEQTLKAQIKEEIELAIMEIQTEENLKGNKVTLNSLSNGQLQSKLEDIIANLNNNEIIGEYKNYDYTINSDFKVEIGEKTTGIKAIANVEILTSGYMFEGTVEIKLTASVESGGNIKEIILPEGVTLLEDLTDTNNNIEKIYTVTKGGNYIFKIVTDNGRITTTTADVRNFLEPPKFNISNNIGTSITVNVENNYPQDINILYSYYLNSTPKTMNTEEKSCTINGLTEGTQYTVKLVLTYNGKTFEIEQNVITSKKPIRPKINVCYDLNNALITPLDYPLLTSNGVMNCKVEPKIGCNMEITIENPEDDVTNYYSLDGGITWNVYTSPFQTTYQEEGKILAKSVISSGLESKITILQNYILDKDKDCSNEKALNKKAYDQDISTCCDTGNNLILMVDDSIKGEAVSVIIFQHDNFRAINMYNHAGGLYTHSPNFYITSPTYQNILEFVYTIPTEISYISFGFSDVDVYEVRLSNKSTHNSYNGSEEAYIWDGK